LAADGAVVIGRQLIEKILCGDLSHGLLMTIDFLNDEMAEAAFREHEYLDLLLL
jgi:hypothetical protein